jgi:hypothetical protein
MTYPKRKSHHAHRVVRQLAKSCGAQQIGPDAAWLITVIAHVEDAKRYSGPVTFYNGQLMPIMGITKWDRFDRIRRRAVEAGWLHYDASPKGSRKAGVYWTLIPTECNVLDDSAIDESLPPSGDSTLPLNGDCLGDQTGIVSGNERGLNGVMTRGTTVPSPNPTPSPSPKETIVRVTKADFDEWYAAYPRKAKPKVALTAYQKAAREIVGDSKRNLDASGAVAFLLKRAEAFSASDKGQGDYCPHPSTWLNAGSYDEEDHEWKNKNGKPDRKDSSIYNPNTAENPTGF